VTALEGKCYCGAVRTGSAFKPFGGIERPKLELTDGVGKLLVQGVLTRA
jgi:hypothetical protein